MSRTNEGNRTYDLFISHSGAPQRAKLIRSRLTRIGAPLWRFENLNVFLDLQQTRTGDNLSESISNAIKNSKYFLLLASQAAARSRWVAKEIALWLNSGKPASHILIVVLDGTIAWDEGHNDFDWTTTDCIPRILSEKYKDEPCWAELRDFLPKALTRIDKQRLELVCASVAARIMDVPKTRILRGEVKRKRRLVGLSLSIVMSLMVSLVLLAFLVVRVRRIPVDNLYNEGVRLVEQRRNLAQVREGLDKLTLALEQDPLHQGALLAKAFALTLLVGYGGSANPAADHEAAEHILLSVANKGTPEYYHVKGRLALFKDWDFPAAIVNLEEAVRCDGNNTEAMHSLANAYTFLGEHEQATRICLQAIDIAFKQSGGRKDKKYTRSKAMLAWVYYHAKDYKNAEALCVEILTTEDPTYDPANRYLGQIYAQQGDYDRAIVHFTSAGGNFIENTNLYANLTCAIALKGDREQANIRIQRLIERRNNTYVSHYRLAQCYACLGETNKALDELHKAREDKGDVFVLWSAVDPLLSPLQGNGDFHDYLKSLGLRQPVTQQIASSPAQARTAKSAK